MVFFGFLFNMHNELIHIMPEPLGRMLKTAIAKEIQRCFMDTFPGAG